MTKKYGIAYAVRGRARKKGTVKFLFFGNEFQRNMSFAGFNHKDFRVRKIKKRVV